MHKIYLTRHGQDMDNKHGLLNGHRDQPLSDIGIKQAQELAEKIGETGIVFDKIYSSPLKRAFKTAEIISERAKLPRPEVLQDLIERDFGIMTGLPISKISEMCAPDIVVTDKITYFLKPQGGETFPEVIERVHKILNYLENEHAKENILLVTHGDTGKMLYAAYYKLAWEEVLTMFHFGNSDLIELSNTSKPEDTHVIKIRQHNN